MVLKNQITDLRTKNNFVLEDDRKSLDDLIKRFVNNNGQFTFRSEIKKSVAQLDVQEKVRNEASSLNRKIKSIESAIKE